MIIIRTPAEMRDWSLAARATGSTIGFVPTMGALHEGHASLLRAAAAQNDKAVASIFVNPTQFAPNEDFAAYPRTFDADRAMCEEAGIGVIYAPDANALYPEGYATYVNVEKVSAGLCGASRPIFFRGVATVVAKLFNTVLPHRAYFGQKDAQQCAVIRRMTRDLDFGVEIVEMPTVREADGLAMSSRNRYLTPEERQQALAISRGLFKARAMMEGGERDSLVLVNAVRNEMDALNIDYVELVDANTIEPLARATGRVLLAAAAWVGKARLIDNIQYEVPEQ
ncbi:MAG: pantoate--beta-alanine ligase [Candidatus Hydrogenedentes bacterium]|nr:pantoate--beta-alanine ligase [Candidatus Hydrogenedentota bacterium]